MHYPPETTSIMLLAKIFAMVEQAEDKEALLLQFNQVFSDDNQAYHKAHTFLICFHLFFQFCQHTVNAEEVISLNLLGFKFRNQIDILREALISSVPTEHCKQVENNQ